MSKRRRKPTRCPASAAQVAKPQAPEAKAPWWFPLVPATVPIVTTFLQWWLTHGHR